MNTLSKRPAPRTQQERVADSSQRLLVAAIELIAEQGFERTTAAQIGLRAGLSRDMVRVRFGSKEALLESLLESEYTKRMFLPPDDNPDIEVVLQWIQDNRTQMRREAPLMRALYTLVFEAAGPIPSVRPWLKRWFAQCESVTAAALLAGQRKGTIRKDIEVGAVATQFISSGMGLGFRWLLDGDTKAYDKAMEGWLTRFKSFCINTERRVERMK